MSQSNTFSDLVKSFVATMCDDNVRFDALETSVSGFCQRIGTIPFILSSFKIDMTRQDRNVINENARRNALNFFSRENRASPSVPSNTDTVCPVGPGHSPRNSATQWVVHGSARRTFRCRERLAMSCRQRKRFRPAENCFTAVARIRVYRTGSKKQERARGL